MDDSASLPSGLETDLFTLFLQKSRCALSEVNLLPLKTVFFSGFLSLLLRNAAVSNQNCVRPEASVRDCAFRADSESQRRALGSVQSRDEKPRQSFLFPHASVMPRPCFSRYDAGEMNPPRQMSLCAARAQVLLQEHFCWLQHEQNSSQNLWSHQGKTGKAIQSFFLCKAAGFPFDLLFLILKCPPLCIFTDSLTHWQSLKLFLNQKREIQHTHKWETLFLRFSGELYLSKCNFLPRSAELWVTKSTSAHLKSYWICRRMNWTFLITRGQRVPENVQVSILLCRNSSGKGRRYDIIRQHISNLMPSPIRLIQL